MKFIQYNDINEWQFKIAYIVITSNAMKLDKQ